MKKIALLILVLFSIQVHAGEWVIIKPEELKRVEVLQKDFESNIAGGVYFMHNTSFTSSEVCPSKQFIAVTESKLADQALSAGLFAIAAEKSIMLWVDGCSNSKYLSAKGIAILP